MWKDKYGIQLGRTRNQSHGDQKGGSVMVQASDSEGLIFF